MNFDELKQQAENLAQGQTSEIEQGAEKVAELAKDKLGHEDEIDGAVDKLKGFLGN